MAAPKKKVVTKDDLRRFMKEKQSHVKASSKVDHPLAKYNSLNQLICVLCSNVIKNDLLWQAHILSKQHKEKVLALKTQGPAKPEHLLPPSAKRKGDEPEEPDSKKVKTGLKPPETDQEDVKERARAAFLAGYSSSSEDDDDDEEQEEKDDLDTNSNKTTTQQTPAKTVTASSSENGLPADFFDSEVEPTEAEAAHSKTMSEILPEGFFDDPKLDAKVRNVEYKDKDEAEWELFQKAIKEEAHVSEVIIEEEDEQVNIVRKIDEIDDQILRWQEVENLHVKKEIILKSSKNDGAKKTDSDDEVDEDELDQILDWRVKSH
ncbi:zinc finger protein 830-like [Physella acuta]|uniref:zinc finger protein 830-like n=1 Tax=Physella acuta TaxID=109671 RepID=UPI0027DB8E57|nr:zinc finger protein 830-like [Physella acuta]